MMTGLAPPSGDTSKSQLSRRMRLSERLRTGTAHSSLECLLEAPGTSSHTETPRLSLEKQESMHTGELDELQQIRRKEQLIKRSKLRDY